MGGKPRYKALPLIGPWHQIGVVGAEHFIAESGWMLARVQRDASCKTWEWSVSTTRKVIDWGAVQIVDNRAEPYFRDLAKSRCKVVLQEQYRHLARILGGPAGPGRYRK